MVSQTPTAPVSRQAGGRDDGAEADRRIHTIGQRQHERGRAPRVAAEPEDEDDRRDEPRPARLAEVGCRGSAEAVAALRRGASASQPPSSSPSTPIVAIAAGCGWPDRRPELQGLLGDEQLAEGSAHHRVDQQADRHGERAPVRSSGRRAHRARARRLPRGGGSSAASGRSRPRYWNGASDAAARPATAVPSVSERATIAAQRTTSRTDVDRPAACACGRWPARPGRCRRTGRSARPAVPPAPSTTRAAAEEHEQDVERRRTAAVRRTGRTRGHAARIPPRPHGRQYRRRGAACAANSTGVETMEP